MKGRWVPLSAAVACAVLFGCRPPGEAAGGAANSRRVRVAAAADLRYALDDLARRFEEAHGISVERSYGSSGTFYAQLLNKAPFDLYFSADEAYPQQLEERDLIVPGSRFTYAVGRLVVWVPATSRVDLSRGLHAAADREVRRLSIANPEHAPYGRAAVAALRSAGEYEAVEKKLVFGENVAQALQFVQSGAAEAGIVALSLALAPPVKAQGRYAEVALDAYPTIRQGGAVLRWAADPDAARALRAFVVGREGRAVLSEYGFSLPETEWTGPPSR